MNRSACFSFIVASALFLLSTSSTAHSGRTNAQGCHNDNRNGGYHCHGAPARSAPNIPAQRAPAVGQTNSTTSANCHPSYSGCLRRDAGDYDCAGGSGNGPNFTGRVQVLGFDEFDLDRDGDGWGCE